MPALTADKLEKILDDKVCPLSEQLKQALESISTLHTKYDNIKETVTQLEKDKTALAEANASLRAQVLSITNDLKQAKKSLNDLEQDWGFSLSRNQK